MNDSMPPGYESNYTDGWERHNWKSKGSKISKKTLEELKRLRKDKDGRK